MIVNNATFTGGGIVAAEPRILNFSHIKNQNPPLRTSQVVSSDQTIKEEIRNMSYTNTMQPMQSEAVLLTDLSPFGGTTQGR